MHCPVIDWLRGWSCDLVRANETQFCDPVGDSLFPLKFHARKQKPELMVAVLPPKNTARRRKTGVEVEGTRQSPDDKAWIQLNLKPR